MDQDAKARDAENPRAKGLRKGPLGAYRRAVRITADAGVATAEMEDDVHHFEVTLRLAGDVVTSIEPIAHRTPYNVCPGSVDHLKTLEGATPAAIIGLGTTARFTHCTHLYDLAILAASHLRDDNFTRLYRIEVDHDLDPPLATLWRDGTEVLSWRADQGRIRGSPFDGVVFAELSRHLAGRTAEEAEAAIVLRRASLISFVRRYDLDTMPAMTTPAVCFTKQPPQSQEARRNIGTTREFARDRRWPLAGGQP